MKTHRPLILLAAVLAASAGLLSAQKDLSKMAVVGVTDMTSEGRKLPPVSPDTPVYYQAVVAGYQDYGRVLAGEKEPDHDAFLQTVLRALKKQGYLPSTKENEPSIVIGFSWGSMRDDLGGALVALGGNKVDLMWEVQPTTGLQPKQWLRGLRSETADRVLEMAKSDLFVMNISAYDRHALVRGKRVMLWNTRISSPARGVWAAEALPQIVEVGAPIIGRETDTPQITTVAEAFGRAGEVQIGEATVVEEDFDLDELEVLDLTKEDPDAK